MKREKAIKVYGGIYLQTGSSQIVFIDAQSRVVFRKQLRNELSLVLQELKPFKRNLEAAAVASTDRANLIVSGLLDAGYRLYLFHPPACDNDSKIGTSDETSADLLATTMRNILLQTDPPTGKSDRIASFSFRKFLKPLIQI